MPNWTDDDGHSCFGEDDEDEGSARSWGSIEKRPGFKALVPRAFKEAKTRSRFERADANEEKTTFIRDDNMKITAVRYERVSNLGNYETERLASEAELEKGDTPEGVVLGLRKFVNEQLGIEQLTVAELAKLEAEVQEKEQKLERARRRGVR